MPETTPKREDFDEKSDSTQAMRRLYAKRYKDYIEDQIDKLWEGELTQSDAINLVGGIGDPQRRDTYLQTLWWAEKQPFLVYRAGNKQIRKVSRELLGKDGSRVFKEALTADLLADAQEALQKAGFGDLLSSLAYRIGSHQGVRAGDMGKNDSLGDLFEE